MTSKQQITDGFMDGVRLITMVAGLRARGHRYEHYTKAQLIGMLMVILRENRELGGQGSVKDSKLPVSRCPVCGGACQ